MDNKIKKLKGSYTVEMALLAGIWLFVIFASLLLILGTYGRILDTAGAIEIAVYGSMEAVPRKGEGIKMAKHRAAAMEKNYTVSGSKREITVDFLSREEMPFGNLSWKYRGNKKSKVVRPVLFIERVNKTREFIGNFTD